MKIRPKNSLVNNKALFRFLGIAVMSCFLFSSRLMAVCGDFVEEEDYFGHAEICPFKQAVEGTEAVDPNDIAFLNAVEATRVINRWYARLLGGQPQFNIEDIQNTSTGVAGAVVVPATEIDEDALTFSLIGGHIWEHWAMEGEIFLPKKLESSQSVFDSALASAVAATVELQQIAFFFNLEYVIPKLFSWYPRALGIHLNAGAGAVLKQTHVSTFNPDGTPRDVNDRRDLYAAGNLGIGARYQVLPKWLVGISYRYLALGKTVVGPIGGVILQSNESQVNGYFFEVTYQF